MAMKWADGTEDSLAPVGKESKGSGNFFDTNDGSLSPPDYLDMKRMDSIMDEWKREAYKKNRKKARETVEIRPEMIETIGMTVMLEDGFPIPQSEVTPHSLSSGATVAMDAHRDAHQRSETSPPDMKAPDESGAEGRDDIDHWSVPTIRDTINRILIDQPYVLEWYKSLEDKLLLLKEAISTHDNNTIITVILFIRRTLSKNLFEKCLFDHPVAAQQYCSFLRQNQAWEPLKSIYFVLGEKRYAMLQYQMCLGIDSIPKRLENLEVIKLLFQRNRELQAEAPYIEEYIKLLKRQQNIEKLRSTLPASLTNKYQGVPLIDSALITTLTYCIRFHAKKPENDDVSPEVLKKDFSIAEKQYFVIMFSSLCANKDWDTVDRLLTPKGWGSKLGLGSKVKGPIPIERVIRILGRRLYRVPEERMVKYLKMVENPETRLQLASKYECYGVGIEVLKQIKDTERLKAFVSSIPAEKQRIYRPMIVKMFS